MIPMNLGKTCKKLLSYMGNHAFMFLLIGILVSISGLANLLGTFMIRPIVNSIGVSSFAVVEKNILIMAIIFLIGVISCVGYTQLMALGAQKVIQELRSDLMHKTLKMPIHVFDTTSHGDLMSRFTNDVDTISDALNNSFAMMIQSFIQVVGTIIFLFLLNWQLTLIVLVFYILMFIYIQYSSKKSKYYFSFQQKQLGKLNGFVEEMMNGQKVVKIFNHEQANIDHFNKENSLLQKTSQKALSFAQTMVPMVVSLSYVNYALVAVIGGYMVLQGQSDVGSLASYLVFVRQAAMPINQFSQQANIILSALSGAERIFNFMEIEPEVNKGIITLTPVKALDGTLYETNTETGLWAWRHPREKGIELVPLEGHVCFRHVNFGYVSDSIILKDLSFQAHKGQKIAFVGATGAGKTTITNLLNRFYDIQSGQILYDGIDIKLIKKEDLRTSLGIVLQDTHLFTGTILDNIQYGRLNATRDECIEAAKLANADSFISRLPEGYDTIITHDGSNLSQGQRQLLAIARVAVADPPVLILDEATSSIDTRTEQMIEKGMDQLMKGRTVFVIAHRLSTVRNADQIIVLDQGRIIEQGNHASLIKQRGQYFQLYNGMLELS